MTKTILIIAITATLILGTFTLGNNASAVISENPALQSKVFIFVGMVESIITKWGPATCMTEEEGEGVSCGVGQAKAKFRLLVTEFSEEGTAIGDAQGKIKLAGIKVSNPGDTTLTNIGLLSFEYDAGNKILFMSGNFIDKKGKLYEFDATGDVGEFEKKKKVPIDLTVQLVRENGIVIDFTSAGILIDGGAADDDIQ